MPLTQKIEDKVHIGHREAGRFWWITAYSVSHRGAYVSAVGTLNAELCKIGQRDEREPE